jgi:hypothetical protein
MPPQTSRVRLVVISRGSPRWVSVEGDNDGDKRPCEVEFVGETGKRHDVQTNQVVKALDFAGGLCSQEHTLTPAALAVILIAETRTWWIPVSQVI